jgi:hypothetical protein
MPTDNSKQIKLEATENIFLLQETDSLCEGSRFFGTSEKVVLKGEFFTVATDARANELIKKELAIKAV